LGKTCWDYVTKFKEKYVQCMKDIHNIQNSNDQRKRNLECLNYYKDFVDKADDNCSLKKEDNKTLKLNINDELDHGHKIGGTDICDSDGTRDFMDHVNNNVEFNIKYDQKFSLDLTTRHYKNNFIHVDSMCDA
jgi:hypothetical protein